MNPEAYTVQRRVKETADTFSIELESDGAFRFEPGQFSMLYAFGVGEIPISISGSDDTRDRLVHTIRGVGTTTSAFSGLRRGDQLGVRGPFGVGWPMEEAKGKDVVVIAGGIGLAPIRPAIEHILANRAEYGRFTILYGARSPEDILYSKDLAHWSSLLDVEVMVTVDRASREWRGSVGVITTLIGRAPIDPDDSLAMVCGPEIMMRYAVQHLRRRGVRPDQIFVSLERNMRCAVGRCGHCQFGPAFVCKDGPVFRFSRIEPFFRVREL